MVDSIDDSSCLANALSYSMRSPPVFDCTSVSSSSCTHDESVKVVPVESAAVEEDPMKPNVSRESVFISEIYHSSCNANANANADDKKCDNMPVKLGRPNLPGIFAELQDLCRKEGLRRVAVSVCGPSTLVNQVFDLCQASQLSCDSTAARFDCHKEIFDF